MSPLVEDVRQKNLRENVRSDKNAKADLEHDVAALTKLLDAGSLDATDEAGARFYRALAHGVLVFLRIQDGEAPDTATAKQALSDLDLIITGKSDIPRGTLPSPTSSTTRAGSRGLSFVLTPVPIRTGSVALTAPMLAVC